MKRSFILFIILSLAFTSVKAAQQQQGSLDSLKQQLQLITNDSLKAPIYSQIVNEYLKYDTISNRRTKWYYQNEALNYTMMALHLYSRYDDTLGLRTCFDALAKVYTSQRKLIQAKWFTLQSMTISRTRKDTASLIPTLVKLAAIKGEIKDYKLAMADLNEALSLSQKSRAPLMEALVMKNYGFLYNRMKDYDKGNIALAKADAILDSVTKAEEMKLTAATLPADTTAKVVVAKKKVLAVNTRKKQVRKPISKKIVASL